VSEAPNFNRNYANDGQVSLVVIVFEVKCEGVCGSKVS
jgi:hypothetical protein